MRKAKEEERITVVPVDHSKPVDVFFDLGWADCTSMWFVQTVGKEIRVIDFYQNQLQKIQHYAQLLQNKGYVYGKMFLPHDAFNNQLSGKNTDQTLRELGFKTQRVEKLGIQEGIQAARTLFPSLWFDAGRCADGLQALKKYRYDVDPDTGKWSKEPLHDENSHAADAFRYLAVGYRPPIKKVTTSGRESGGWMSL
jgi:phage terminase large subunit